MQRLSKVPQITAAFWIIKILTTGMGEALADYFDHAFDPVIVVVASGLVLAVILIAQVKSRKFSAGIYWAAVSMVSVFGTLAADAVHVIFGVPYWASSSVFLVALISIFVIWHGIEKTISIASIVSVRTELFYWIVVMGTFALGTAAGDMTAITFNWGFLPSGLIFSVAFALPLILYISGKGKSVLLFWAAYILTRPLGASYADWLALPVNRGGMDWGTLKVSLALITAIAVFVIANRNSSKALSK
jgi:uncharacterized membrane-anchored protein